MERQELTLAGLTDDGTELVLVSDSGQEFTLPADATLRAALRGDHARLGQLEITMESALRPRDIQARIRAGETPESVAEAASTSLDKIMGYATPVLAERAHIAERAQRASVRRKAGEGSSRMLGDAVADQLRSRNVDPESVAWDAWRREDGRWTLVADYRADDGNRHAEFVFDAPGRYVVAEDDEARWLVGEESASTGPQPRTAPGRRLSAVPSDDELPLGEDAIGMVSELPDAAAPAAAAAPPSAPPSALPPAPAAAAENGQPVHTDQADWIATQASERPQPARRAPAEEAPVAGPAADDETKKPSKKRGRASVPSWDEIMFGGGKAE
jgi:DUF3071 family protein